MRAFHLAILAFGVFLKSDRAAATALADFHRIFHLAIVYSYRAIAFMVLRAATKYMSRVKPLTMRLMPTTVSSRALEAMDLLNLVLKRVRITDDMTRIEQYPDS